MTKFLIFLKGTLWRRIWKKYCRFDCATWQNSLNFLKRPSGKEFLEKVIADLIERQGKN
jgi:hypothetical protein